MPADVTDAELTDGAVEHEPEVQDDAAEGASEHDPVDKDGTENADETAAELSDEEIVDSAFTTKDDAEDEAEKPESEAKDDAPKDEDAPADDEKPVEKGDKPDPDALTETERKNVSKAVVKKLERVLRDRSELRRPAAFGKSIAEKAAKARFDNASFQGWVDTGCELNTLPHDQAAAKLADIAINVANGGAEKAKGLTAVQRADSLRKLADRIAPAPKPAAQSTEPQFLLMPQDLADLVASEAMQPEEAQALALQRHRKANPPKQPEKAAEVEAERKPEQTPPRADGVTPAEVGQGKAAAEAEWARLAKVHGDNFKAIEKGVLARIVARADTTHPRGFVRLVQDSVAAELAARRVQLKKPPVQVRGKPPAKSTKAAANSFDEAIDEAVARA